MAVYGTSKNYRGIMAGENGACLKDFTHPWHLGQNTNLRYFIVLLQILLFSVVFIN